MKTIEEVDNLITCQKILSKLSEREQFVVMGRSNGFTLKYIAGKLDITRERVRQIQLKAVQKMERYLHIKIDFYSFHKAK